MQTIDRPSAPPRRPPPWAAAAGTVAAVALLPLLLLAIFTKWGVLIALAVAFVAGIAIWVRYKGFVYLELVAFLIHFDGIGVGPVRMGRIVAATAAIYIVYKLVSGWRPPALPLRHWGPIWLLTCWAVLSGFWSAQSGGWFYNMAVFGLGLAFFCVGAMLLESHRKVQQFLRAYWVGGLFGTAAGLLALVLGTRSVGFGQDANFFGLLQASMIPLTVYYRRHAPTVQAKHLYSVVLVLVVAGAAGAGSRSGLIGSSLAIIATMVTRPGLSMGTRVRTGAGAAVLAAIAGVLSFLANPNLTERGLHDRGAGRLDMWNVAMDLIRENALWGYGFGQLRAILPSNLLLTPGSQLLTERRVEVSAHNTWMDVWGDLGVFGFLLFLTVFIVTIIGFARPRWLETRELSTTLLIMLIPVLSGSFFLPLLNNKLAWALIGISAALQVPSAESRWRGLVAPPPRRREPAAGGVPAVLGSARSDPAGSNLPVPVDATSPAIPLEPGTRPHAPGEEVFPPVELAKWDLGFPRRLFAGCVLVAVLCGVVAGAFATTRPTTYTATAGVLLSNVDGSQQNQWVRTDVTRLQVALTMAISGAYAEELRSLSGIDRSIEDIRDSMFATRVRMGFYVEIQYTDTDAERAAAVTPHLLTALDNVYANAQEFASDVAEDQRRPIFPGETLVYRGPAYLHAYDDVIVSENPPRVLWYAFLGALLGGLGSVGVVLSGQRRPRVSPKDHLDERVGLAVWARIGSRSGPQRGTRLQYAQALSSARAHVPHDVDPRRLVVTAPRVGRHAEHLALGLACELVGEGRRVVLVDARPPGRARLGVTSEPGLSDVLAGDAQLLDVMAAPDPRRLPRLGRELCGGRVEQLRVVPAGSVRHGRPGGPTVVDVVDQIDPSVAVVVLAPPVGGPRPVADLLSWADATMVAVVTGRTPTDALESTASSVRDLGRGASGVVLVGA